MSPEQTELMVCAGMAAQNAYAPYSKFKVGAAVLTKGGIFTGANIENACTNLGICAERVAIANARMDGFKKIIGIAINCVDAPKYGNGNIKESLTMPCGACLQWFAELAPDAWIITNASDRVFKLADLLPIPFVFGA